MLQMYSRDGSVSLSTESWPTSVTPPGGRRRYDNAPRDGGHLQLVPAARFAPACGGARDCQQQPAISGAPQLANVDAARRLDLAAAAAGGGDDATDHDVTSKRHHNEMVARAAAVRPWLMHSCDR